MSTGKHPRRRNKGGRGRRGKNHEVAGELEAHGGGLDTKPYKTKAEISVREIWYAVPSRLDPFPPRYRTTLTAAIRGNIPAGTGPVLYWLRSNSPYLPFASGTWTGGLPSIATLNSTGFSSLCNQFLYQNFRCRGSRVTVELAPVADVDIMQVTLTPSALPTTPTSTATALAQPYTKSMMVQRGQPKRDCTLINKMSMATLIGVTERAIEDDISGQAYGTYTSFPNDVQYWVLNIVREDGGTTNSAIGYKVTVQYDVEFFADAAAVNIETIMAQAIAKTPLPQNFGNQVVLPETTERLTKQLNKLLHC